MASEGKSSSQWREKAGSLFSSSSSKLREIASKASVAASNAAGVTSSKVKSTWETTRQEWNTKVQPKLKSTLENTKQEWNEKVQPKVSAGLSTAARVTAETGSKLKTGFIEVRDKAASTKVAQQIKEATKTSFKKSKTLLAKVNFIHKNKKDPNAVFGVPMEELVARQSAGSRPIPRIVALCSDYLTARGLTTAYLFENEGSTQTVMRLMKLFDQDCNANIPLGTSSLDVAQLLKVYFRTLPEPLLTFDLYDSIIEVGGSNVQSIRNLLNKLPAVNQSTLGCLCALLKGVSEKSAFNKMNARSLATEFAPLLAWKVKISPEEEGNSPYFQRAISRSESGGSRGSSPAKSPVKVSPTLDNDASPPVIESVNSGSIEVESQEEMTYDDDLSGDQNAIVDFVLCLVEQYEAVFTNLIPISV